MITKRSEKKFDKKWLNMGRLLVLLLVGLVSGWRDSRPRMVVDYLKQHAGKSKVEHHQRSDDKEES